MNYKLYFPTYRTRWRWVTRALTGLTSGSLFDRALNVGCGEGDIDRVVASHCAALDSIDVNEGDIAFARSANSNLPNVRYAVGDAERLPFPDAAFDVVVCLEVIEHVQNPARVLCEIARVLRPGGHALLTCPRRRFPVSYDPINFALSRRERHLPFGAYGYGHDWLVDEAELDAWIASAELRITSREHLSGALASAVECYWPGLLQRVLKPNARNGAGAASGKTGLRPRAGEPPLLSVVDALVDLDARIGRPSERSVGLAYRLERPR